jgi:hypothetical protein
MSFMASPLAPNSDHRGRHCRASWVVLWVLAGTALALRTADALASMAAGIPRGVHPCTSLAQAEARTGIRLDPLRRALDDQHLAAQEILRTDLPAVAITLHRSEKAQDPISYFHSATGEIPDVLRSPLPAFHEIAVSLGPDRTASLKAAALADGSVWQDVEWTDGNGRAALRSRGRTVELLRLARRIVEGSP